MVSTGIGKDFAQRSALKVTVNVIGMIKFVELSHQKS
jgi:hypothetical protein